MAGVVAVGFPKLSHTRNAADRQAAIIPARSLISSNSLRCFIIFLITMNVVRSKGGPLPARRDAVSRARTRAAAAACATRPALQPRQCRVLAEGSLLCAGRPKGGPLPARPPRRARSEPSMATCRSCDATTPAVTACKLFSPDGASVGRSRRVALS